MALPLLLLSAFGSGYFLREVLDPAPDTENFDDGYVPPFTGGQCEVLYAILFAYDSSDPPAGIRYAIFGGSGGTGDTSLPADSTIRSSGASVFGSISNFTQNTVSQSTFSRQVSVTVNGVSITFSLENSASNLRIFKVLRKDGQLDNCGDIPNPNPIAPPNSSGLASSPSPNPSGFVTVSEGLAPLATSGIGAALAAALAALRAAGDLAAAAAAIADALAALKEFLDALEENEDKDKKKENRKLLQYDFGSVSGDGYLELFPENSPTDRELLFLDIQIKSFPIGRGKIFGKNSPNRYPFEPFGNIRFVTPTFGVLCTHSVEHIRTSVEGSDKATGFFYHFGLDRRVTANITGFYSELIPEPEE